ncbi:hypothetical protein BH11PAT4_BH11PAT4_4140 [soil metagenome]
MKRNTLEFKGDSYEMGSEDPIADFRLALAAIYGDDTWSIDEAVYPIEIFVPKGEVANWRPKVGFVKNTIFGGERVLFREYSAAAARHFGR